MFYNYEIKNINNEEVLYLYLTMKYEFSNEFSKDLGRRTKNFIQNNNIPFKGNKVYLIVDGVVVKTVNISDLNNIKKRYAYSADNFNVNIMFEDNSLCEITLREYLLSVLLSNYLDNITDEVLKAICVLYNTYSYKMMSEDNYILSDNGFSKYLPISYYKNYVKDYDNVINKLNIIIDSVDCIYISYKNDYILPFIHYSNSGKTISNSRYPYLSSVKSLWDMISPNYIKYKDISYLEINNKLNIDINYKSKIQIYRKNNNKKILFDDKVFDLEDLIKLFELNSSNVYIIIYNKFLRFITIGVGHGYGLSIFGSIEISKSDTKYYDILKYYFPKTKLYKNIKEL